MEDTRFETATYGPALWCLIPITALALLLVLAIRHDLAARSANKHLKPTTVAWTLPHLVLLASSVVWYAKGIGSASLPSLVVFCVACVLSGSLTLHRDDRFPPVALLLVAITILGVLTLELSWNAKFYTIAPHFWLVETALVGATLFASWYFTGRRGIGPALVLSALCFIGVAQHYVLSFRGTSILPSDIFAFGTALSVSGGYTYGLSTTMLRGFTTFALGICCCSLLWRGKQEHALIPNLCFGAASLGLVVALVFVPSYADAFGAQMDYWWSKDWYERQGFLPSFIFNWQDLKIQAPEGYSEEAAKSAQEKLSKQYLSDSAAQQRRGASTAQFAQQPPNIFVIQNEAFCDLSTFDGLRNGYTGPDFWNNGIPEATLRGNFAVSVFGGGTCNTEFEFLTGNSLAYLGSGKFPFTMYDLSTTDSLAHQLANIGYYTIGMHPNNPTNWNRKLTYDRLGFHEFLSEEHFAGAEQYHMNTSDWATYERALDLLKQHSEPTFVFDVTMQNHSGYDTGSIPKDQLRNYTIEGLSENDTFQMNEYLACVDESDRAFQRLIAALKEFDEPTIVVMFGDHQPWPAQGINDVLYPNEDELTHAERIHHTCYRIWSNYEIAGGADAQTDGGDTSSDLLAAMMLDAIGAPLTNYQEALLGARKDIRAVNANGYLATDGTWHPLAEAPRELGFVQHLNFGSKI